MSNRSPYILRNGYDTVAIKSVQLPTGSATNASGRASSVNFFAASTNELNLQQKHPPGISSVANPRARSIDVSTSSLPWSFVIGPTRNPALARYCAKAATAVVFPAPRNPPIMKYCVLLLMGCFGLLLLLKHSI